MQQSLQESLIRPHGWQHADKRTPVTSSSAHGTASASGAASSEQEYKKIFFRPGLTGLRLTLDGKVYAVDGGQAKDAGVLVGWRLVLVNRGPYTPERLNDHIGGAKDYHVIFAPLQKTQPKEDEAEVQEQDWCTILNGKSHYLTKYWSSGPPSEPNLSGKNANEHLLDAAGRSTLLLSNDGERSQQDKNRWKCLYIILSSITALTVLAVGIYEKAFVVEIVKGLWRSLENLGLVACPIICVVCCLLTSVALPAFPIEVGAGALFENMYGMTRGTFTGMITCGVGVWCGCIIAFALGRKFFKPKVQKCIKSHQVLQNVNEIISEEGWKFSFLMRLNPLIPFELFNYAVAMTDISPFHNAVAALGTMPVVCFEVYSAASAASIASAATSGSKEGTGDEIKQTLIKLAISGILIAIACAYGKFKYDAKVAQRSQLGNV